MPRPRKSARNTGQLKSELKLGVIMLKMRKQSLISIYGFVTVLYLALAVDGSMKGSITLGTIALLAATLSLGLVRLIAISNAPSATITKVGILLNIVLISHLALVLSDWLG
jgi:hypothetical protein